MTKLDPQTLAAVIEAIERHAVEPQVMVETKITDTPREVAVRECVEIVRIMGQAEAPGLS